MKQMKTVRTSGAGGAIGINHIQNSHKATDHSKDTHLQ
jgi:hypothetical protein